VMAYNTNLADSVREYLAEIPCIDIEEKEMFNVLNFMVNDKTCVCVSGEKLMLRFDPSRQEELCEKDGYETMLMKGKEYKGYCYLNPDGFKDRKEFEFFLTICLEYNKIAKSSKKRKTK
jgi:TfoX N-terminal domain